MLGGKAGIVNIHMGDTPEPFEILYRVMQKSELKFTQFLPTHCNRNHYIFEDVKTYGKQGPIDLTASSYPYYPDTEVKASEGVVTLTKAGVPLEHITISSDGCGSLPDFDEKGNLVRLDSGEPASIFTELMDLVEREKWPFEKALKPLTSNVADVLKLRQKGRIIAGADADVVLLDMGNKNRICHLAANGSLMVKNYEIIKPGTFDHLTRRG